MYTANVHDTAHFEKVSRLTKHSSERGSALLLTIVVIIILLFLGSSLGLLTMAESRMAQREEARIQAFYLARSGADAMAEAIIKRPAILEDIELTEGHSAISELNDDLGNGSFQVTLTKIAGNGVLIQSTGNAGKQTSIVSLKLDLEPGDGFDFDMAIFAGGEGNDSAPAIRLDNGTINGDIGTNATEAGAVKITGNPTIDGDLYVGPYNAEVEIEEWVPRVYSSGEVVLYNGVAYKNQWWTDEQPDTLQGWTLWNPVVETPSSWNKVHSLQTIDTIKEYPDVVVPTPPEGLPPRGTLTVEGGVDQEIASDGQYDRIYVTSNRTLTIDLQGGTRRIRVSELHLGPGHIVLKNVGENGKLELYVENSFTATGNSSINVEGSESGDHSNLTLVYTGKTPFGGQGASTFHQYRFSGNLIVEQAEVRVGAGSSFAGNILSNGNAIRVNGGATTTDGAIYAPKADFTVSGGPSITGAVICETTSVSGGSTITFDPYVESGFPFEMLWSAEGSPGTVVGYMRGSWSSN